jgi:hypothetical protein
MKGNTGVILLLIIIVLIGFSFYRGYLVLSSRQQPTTHNTEIKLIVDEQKLKNDTEQAGKDVQKATKDIDLKPGP